MSEYQVNMHSEPNSMSSRTPGWSEESWMAWLAHYVATAFSLMIENAQEHSLGVQINPTIERMLWNRASNAQIAIKYGPSQNVPRMAFFV